MDVLVIMQVKTYLAFKLSVLLLLLDIITFFQ
jgi:hypothetical protein